MLWGTPVAQAVFQVVTSHRAVAAIVIRVHLLDLVDHGPADLHGGVEEVAFHGVGAVVAGAALDRGDFGAGNQLQRLLGLETEILDPNVA